MTDSKVDLERQSQSTSSTRSSLRRIILGISLISLGLISYSSSPSPTSFFTPSLAPKDPDFSFLHYSKLCPGLEFIDAEEFTERRDKLAGLLSEGEDEKGWGAWVSEPSPNTLYYTNLSTSSWYLSERPWLISITPFSPTTSHLTILTPNFELSRSQRLPFALSPKEFEKVSWVTWKEDENPYEVLVEHLEGLRTESGRGGGGWKIHLEENVREFVGEGLREVGDRRGVDVGLAELKVREQRMRKTEKEVELQRCAAKVTIEALRAVRKLLYLGMTESEGERLIISALTTGGLSNLDYIVLFGPNAALPHASASKDKKLEKGEFALFDVGGELGGYISDFTRTMLPDTLKKSIPGGKWGWESLGMRMGMGMGCERHRGSTSTGVAKEFEVVTEDGVWPNERSKKIWETVAEAQIAALEALVNGGGEVVKAKDVDRAAREVIENAGWGEWFTHRVGHGIGLQVHEHPYLNSGNDQELVERETFSDEPGIYIETSVDTKGSGIGVRIEDMVLKTKTGWELVSGMGLAKSPWSP